MTDPLLALLEIPQTGSMTNAQADALVEAARGAVECGVTLALVDWMELSAPSRIAFAQAVREFEEWRAQQLAVAILAEQANPSPRVALRAMQAARR